MTRLQLVRTTLTALAALALAGAAPAQQVYWDSPRPLGAGQRSALDLVFAESEPAGPVAPPAVDGLTVLGPPSRQSSVSIINGQRSSSLTLSFPVRAEREGALRIPEFEVQTSAGPATVASLALDVGAATRPGRGGAKISDAVQARLTPANMTPYAGEVFDVELTVGLSGGRSGQVEGVPSWSPTGANTEPWSAGQAAAGGAAVRFRTRATVPTAGRIELAPARQEVQIESGRERDPFAGLGGRFGGADFFDSFFSRTQMTGATVESNAVQLDVRPLPEPAPAGFSGAVGQFTLESTVAPSAGAHATGDPITWTVSVKGTGNWPSLSLPARAVPNDVRALQPKLHKDFAAGALFDGRVSEDLVLVPSQPGDLNLAPLSFVFFNPESGTYETATAQPPTLHITGAPLAPPAQPQPAALAAQAAAPAPAIAAPAASALLPRDPLRGAELARAPIAWPHLRAALATPFGLLAVFWLALAVRRARNRDPRRARRLAFKQLQGLVGQAHAATTAEARVAALLAWQHAAATALGIDLAAPTAAQLRSAGGEDWVEVWAGSERALYGRSHVLPGGWAERAQALCRRRRLPWRTPLRALRVQSFFPKAATAALLLACLAARANADGLEAYAAGDFAAARAEFLAAAQRQPSDWIARYNLGLVEAQQGADGRALGETLAAFAHAPSSAAVRWNAQAFAARVPGLEHGVAAVLASDLATALPPAGWQALLMLAALLVCGGAGVWLQRRYAGRPRPGVWAPALIGAGVLCAVAATVALQRYGALADPTAAVVAQATVLRSVPTDAEAPAQQRPLDAGALVLAQRDFLGWVQIALPSGETGWLREADLVPLYGAPRA